ncbi:MAG: HD domain-containing protein [Burkholderiaceae bacterium]
MSIIQSIIDIYVSRAEGRYGLSLINQQQHALQAATLAERNGESAAFITAALLHDVGHMVHDLGDDPAANGVDDAHETLAAQWLERHFGADVVEPVRLHVSAKRYLCAVDPGYVKYLSSDSVRSLALQGGAMSPAETAAFESRPYWREAVRLRRLDDAAKDPGAVTPPAEYFRTYLEQALRQA